VYPCERLLRAGRQTGSTPTPRVIGQEARVGREAGAGHGRMAIMGRIRALVAVVATMSMLAMGAGVADAGRASGLQFHAQAQSWVSPKDGWLLGAAGCGATTCTETVRTTDGGVTWKTLGTIAAPLTIEDASGVTEVRFADDLHGWAFGPALWISGDGGATWQPQASPGGRPVIALAADAQVAYAVVSACELNQALSDCRHGATLWRTTPGSVAWTQVSLRLPVSNQAILEVSGLTAYLAIATPGGKAAGEIDVTVDGVHWTGRPDPCSVTDGEYISGIAASSATQVALMCQANIGFGKAYKHVVRSVDTALTTSDAGILPLYGIVSRLASSPNGTLVVSSFSIGSWIYRNGGGQAWTTPEDLGDGGIGWNDIGFPTDQVGFVIHGPVACCGGGGPGELWKSGDGGVSWRQAVVTPQP
jgi:hypothetical protein